MTKTIATFFALCAACRLGAQMIAQDYVATSIGHTFDLQAFSTVDFMMGSFWGAVPAQSFTGNLSNSDLFSLTVSAPPGYRFQVTSASGSIGGTLAFGKPLSDWIAPGWNGILSYSMPTTVSFTDFEGSSWYADTPTVNVDVAGRALLLGGGLWWSGAANFSFTSLTIIADLSSLSSLGFQSLTYTPDLAVGISYQDVLAVDSTIDPGPILALASAVPEPSTYGLTAVGLIGILCVSRKRLTRR